LHSDVVGQFTATGSALDGSTAYDPLGKVLATVAMVGNLGYQSEWTDAFTGRVNMLARWYNTDTGQFDTRDTYSNNPVPASVGANRYQYGDANPMTVTDPSGHCSWYDVVCKTKSAVSTVSSYASSAWSYTYNSASSAYHSAVSWGEERLSRGLGHFSRFADRIGLHKLAKVADKGRKHYAAKAAHHKHEAKKHAAKARQAGHRLKVKAQRAIHKAVKHVKDAVHSTAKWVKEHKDQIIEVAAIVATVAATIALGPVGGLLVGIAINVAKDAAQGNIHSLSDLGKSLAVGTVMGLIGVATGGLGGAIGGKIASAIGGKLGAGLIGRAASGAISGAVSGGVGSGLGDLGTQLYKNHGKVNWGEVAAATGTGAALGAVGGAIGGARAKPPCAGGHSFEPNTRVVMADGQTKPIKDIKIGDEVKATEPTTGKTEAKPVTVLHNNHDSDLADVTIKNTKTGKSSVLHTTWHHPLWNADAKRWTDAAELKPGDHLRDAAGKTAQMVTAIKIWTGLHWMRDLTVDDIHTYYVVAGGTPVLVHNCGGDTPAPSMHDTAIGPVDANGNGPVTLPRMVIDSQKMPNIAQNIRDAHAQGHPMVLNRVIGGKPARDANRKAACAGFCGSGSPDEYPFAASMQGGAGARVTGVPIGEQRIQGGVISGFYSKFNIQPGDPYEVVVQ
jgi:RHS repeat-associated protein